MHRWGGAVGQLGPTPGGPTPTFPQRKQCNVIKGQGVRNKMEANVGHTHLCLGSDPPPQAPTPTPFHGGGCLPLSNDLVQGGGGGLFSPGPAWAWDPPPPGRPAYAQPLSP